MDKHITVLGALFLGLGIMNMIGFGVVLFIFGLGSVIMTTVASQEPDMPALLAWLPLLFAFFICTLIAITAIPNLIVAYGLLARRSWARVVSLIVGIINLPAFPLGTGVGAYAIWVYLQEDTEPSLGHARVPAAR